MPQMAQLASSRAGVLSTVPTVEEVLSTVPTMEEEFNRYCFVAATFPRCSLQIFKAEEQKIIQVVLQYRMWAQISFFSLFWL